MKTTFLKASILFSLFGITSNISATEGGEQPKTTLTTTLNTKKLIPLELHHLNFDVYNFCKYLENGNPKKAEGVYQTPDGRYVIALIKNNEQGHDYIGVVCAADNPYWKKGEIKFNFVLTDESTLNGFYYNSTGEYVPVSYSISGDSLATNMLKKVDVQKIKATTLAWL